MILKLSIRSMGTEFLGELLCNITRNLVANEIITKKPVFIVNVN